VLRALSELKDLDGELKDAHPSWACLTLGFIRSQGDAHRGADADADALRRVHDL
jgi:hypothetical protein